MTQKKRTTPKALLRRKEDIETAEDGVLIASYQGKRPYQEDRFLVNGNMDISAKDAPAFLAGIFKKAAAATEPLIEGSTGTGVVISKDLQLSTAFLGDSPVVVFVRDPKTGDITASQITRDHHPGLADEKARIKAAGGFVDEEERLIGLNRDHTMIHSFAVSRAFGDDAMTGLSREPEFATVDLKKEIAAGREVYILVSSDGLYDGSRPQDYLPPLQDAIETGKELGLAKIFAEHAHRRGSRDNITALVFKVPEKMEAAIFLAVADGHGGSAASEKVIESFAADVKAKVIPPSPSR